MAKVKRRTVTSAGEGAGQRRLDFVAGGGSDGTSTWRNTSAVPPITDRHPATPVYVHWACMPTVCECAHLPRHTHVFTAVVLTMMKNSK